MQQLFCCLMFAVAIIFVSNLAAGSNLSGSEVQHRLNARLRTGMRTTKLSYDVTKVLDIKRLVSLTTNRVACEKHHADIKRAVEADQLFMGLPASLLSTREFFYNWCFPGRTLVISSDVQQLQAIYEKSRHHCVVALVDPNSEKLTLREFSINTVAAYD